MGIRVRQAQDLMIQPPAKIPRHMDGPSPFVVSMVNSLPASVNELLRVFPDLVPDPPTAPIVLPVTERIVNPVYSPQLLQRESKAHQLLPVLESSPMSSPVISQTESPRKITNTNSGTDTLESDVAFTPTNQLVKTTDESPDSDAKLEKEKKRSRTKGQNFLSEETKAGRIYSNDMSHCCKHQCRVCNKIYTLTAMRGHARSHSITIKEYNDKYGSPRDNIITEVWHKCKLCDKDFLLDSDEVHRHANWHQMTLKEFNSRFIILVNPQKIKTEKEESKGDENETEQTRIVNMSEPLKIKKETQEETLSEEAEFGVKEDDKIGNEETGLVSEIVKKSDKGESTVESPVLKDS